MPSELEQKHKHTDWLTHLAHAGYAARGVIYVIIGGIALLAAVGGVKTEGATGALTEMLGAPGGKALLAVTAVGLVGYAGWRFVQGVLDADHHGTGGKGMVIRAGLIVSGVTHVLLAFFALSLVFGWGGGSGDGGQGWTGWLLAKPFGQWLVGAVGAAIIGAGIAQAIKGYKIKFEKYLDMNREVRKWAVPVCRVGLVARGVVFCIIGGFFLLAAYQADAGEARGLGGVLRTLQQQPHGPWLLGLVAVGLLAFSVYSFIEASYRRVHPERTIKAAMPHGP